MIKIGKYFQICAVTTIFCLASTNASAAKISASVSPNPATADDSVLLRVEVEGANANLGRPSFNANEFDVVGQSNSVQSTSQFVGGQFVMNVKHQFSFVLFPKKSGKFTISAIQVQAGNETLRADDIVVLVRDGANGTRARPQFPAPDQDEDADPNQLAPEEPASQSNANNDGAIQEPNQLNSDFTVFVALDRKTAYVGEPIIAEYWVYDFGGVTQMEVKKWPTFDGFWKEDLEIVNRLQFEPIYLHSKRARRVLLGRFALYGIKPGKISIEKLVVDANVLSRSGTEDDSDPFSIPFFAMRSTRHASHASQDNTLDILPMPEQGRPTNFSGAVGSFTVSMTSDKQSLDINTPLNVKVSYEGTGNFPSIDEPKLNLPADFEKFESTVAFKDSVPHGMRRPVGNKKSFNFVLIPRKSGSFTIPAIDFSYFDPKKKSYQTIHTGNISVQVTGTASAANTSLTPSVPSNEPRAPSPAPQELAPLHSAGDLSQGQVLPKIIWGLLGLLSLASLVLLGMLLKKLPWSSLRKQKTKTTIRAQKTIRELKGIKEESAFLARFEEVLYEAASTAIGKNAHGMLREELELEWKEKKLAADLFHQYYKLIASCAALRYSRAEHKTNARNELLGDLTTLLEGLEKHQA